MLASQLFGETLREAPADVDIVSHQLLLRAGCIRPLAAGVFSYLPLGYRMVRKIEQIIREEMDRIDGQEMLMPVVHPASLWQETGRWQSIDETMVRFRDRVGRDMLLAMTHEEVVADLTRQEIRSYRQLPKMVYHIQTKFRDEPRPRGGLIRMREFTMKDSYTLDRDLDGLKAQYAAHHTAYVRIFARAGLPVISVSSDTGMMGGKVAHEFMYLAPIGEDTLAQCGNCGYAANRDVARFAKRARQGTPAPLEKVHTPGAHTIDELAAFLGIPASETAKIVFWSGHFGADAPRKLVVAVVRGDMDVNETAVLNLSKAHSLHPAAPEEIAAAGAAAGFASPIGLRREKALVIVDDLVAATPNLVAGANEADYHLRNTCHGRDYQADIIGHIAAVFEGAECPDCGQPLRLVRGVEVGNIFQLGTRYSKSLGANYLDENGIAHPIFMGSYGIGVDRLMACIAEEHRDEFGLSLPISVAPFQVALVSLARSDETRAAADRLYQSLTAAGVEVLYDDRDARPGVKFADADLRGMPIRLTISDKSLEKGGVELKRRAVKDFRIVALDEVVPAVRGEIEAMRSELEAKVAEVLLREGRATSKA